MKYTNIYKNGKPDYFFIKIDKLAEFEFLRPYFLVTSIEKTRRGSIKDMECLFSGSVWFGKQSHGYGYSESADVYGTLKIIIEELYEKELTPQTKNELDNINTHDDDLILSNKLLAELKKLNDKKQAEKWTKTEA